jgi:serine/threonine protein phosphatase 1
MNRPARSRLTARTQVAPQQTPFRPCVQGAVYAIGDVHGRLDLFERLIDRIRADTEAAGEGVPTVVLLGDLIDRGPASAGCLDRAIALAAEPWCRTELLLGNHEQSLMKFLEDPMSGEPWIRHGGDATIASYGVDPRQASRAGWTGLRDALALAIPAGHLALLAAAKLWLGIGDYIFVHAGVRPGTPMERQTPRDLLWIREPFLTSEIPYPGKVVVHGHTPMPQPRMTRWMIGVDTGAYASGILTAVRLRGYERLILQTI